MGALNNFSEPILFSLSMLRTEFERRLKFGNIQGILLINKIQAVCEC